MVVVAVVSLMNFVIASDAVQFKSNLHILSPSPAQNQCGNIDEMIVHLRTCFAYLYTHFTRLLHSVYWSYL